MTPEEFQQELDKRHHLKLAKEKSAGDLFTVKDIVDKSTQANIDHRATHEPNVRVKNFPEIATPSNIESLTSQVENLNLTTFVGLNGTLSEISSSLSNLSDSLLSASNEQQKTTQNAVKKIVAELPEAPTPLESVEINNLAELQKYFTSLGDELKSSLNKLKLNPKIDVKAPEVKVEGQTLDTTPILESLDGIQQTIKTTNQKQPEINLKPLLDAVKDTTKTIKGLSFPVPNYVLPFQTQTGKAVQLKLNDDGSLPTNLSAGKLVTEKFDYISRTLTNSTTETYVYKSGGSGGATVATVTVVYTDSTLATISTVTKT